jgi:iron complex transport system permease protein
VSPSRPRLVAIAIGIIAIAFVLGSLVIGPGEVGLGDALGVIAARIRGATPDQPPVVVALVWDLRLPRTLLAATVGAALGVAGVVTQGLFRNPLAEPGVLGVSTGAATAAVIGFALGLDRLGLWVTPTLAAVGALAVLAILLALTRPVGSFATLLLSGIAVGALGSAAITLVLSLGTERWDLGLKVVRWLMGSFEGRSWDHLAASVPALAIGLLLATWLRLDLDALQLGSDTAASLGVDLRRTTILGMLTVGALVGMATALTGVIGFLGLVVPHIARMWVGAGHRALLPTAACLGAAVMLAVDAGGRSVSALALPPGAITSLLGAPFFLWLLRRTRPEVM